MKRIIIFLLLSTFTISFTSCATIFTKSSYPITFTSNPTDANITIVNSSGKTLYTGSTPTYVRLKAAAGYMKKEEYSVTFSKEGCTSQTIPLICNMDGWYFGNILIGWLIGFLIIDPASGAMYKFPETNINVVLKQTDKDTKKELRIIDIGQIPEDAELTRIY